MALIAVPYALLVLFDNAASRICEAEYFWEAFLEEDLLVILKDEVPWLEPSGSVNVIKGRRYS
jgi:hypothetical protein